jgi:hypothetical protein
MRIPIGNFIVTSDPNYFILNDEKTYGDESKHKGEKYLVPIGYYTDFSHVLKAILKHTLLRSDARTLSDTMDTLQTMYDEIEDALRRYEQATHSIDEQSYKMKLIKDIAQKVTRIEEDMAAWKKQ